jgi:hypothetical protein
MLNEVFAGCVVGLGDLFPLCDELRDVVGLITNVGTIASVEIVTMLVLEHTIVLRTSASTGIVVVNRVALVVMVVSDLD